MPSTTLRFCVKFVAGLCFIPAFSHAAAKPVEINVGIYAPFSSHQAYIGRSILDALELARDASPSDTVHYQFFTLDELPDGNVTTAQVLQNFVASKHLDVLLTNNTQNGLLAAPIAKDNKIIHFSMGNDQRIADGVNNFLVMQGQGKQNAVMSPQFVQKFKKVNWSNPTMEAGLAYDTFGMLNQSVQFAHNQGSPLSAKNLAANIYKASGTGVMGAYNLNKDGVMLSRAVTQHSDNIG